MRNKKQKNKIIAFRLVRFTDRQARFAGMKNFLSKFKGKKCAKHPNKKIKMR